MVLLYTNGQLFVHRKTDRQSACLLFYVSVENKNLINPHLLMLKSIIQYRGRYNSRAMDIEEQYDKIYRFCYYRVKHKETAEDLTQETFLRFLKSPYEERGERIRYLYTIARNLCTEEMRRERAEALPDDVSDEGLEAEKAGEKAQVNLALGRMSEEDRELLILRYMNEESLRDIYSIGTEGENTVVMTEDGERNYDWSAFFNGVPVRWVDEDGNVVEKQVSPLTYIRIQRKFAEKWSGRALDDSVLREAERFFKKYGSSNEGRIDGWNYQNYYWVWKSIMNLGLNPFREDLSEMKIETLLADQMSGLYENLALSEEERAFWNGHDTLAFPLKLAYTPALRQIFTVIRRVHLMTLFFVILMLSESFSLDYKYRTRPLIQAAKMGPVHSALIRTGAGILVTAAVSVILFAVTICIQFLIFGTDGWNTPVQQIRGLQWSRLMVTGGEAMLIMCASSLLITAAFAAITMFLSEVSRSGNVPIWTLMTALLMTVFIHYGIFYRNRTLAQLWQYLPMQRINDALLYDERLVRIGGHYVMSIPLGMWIYLGLTVVFSVLCISHAIFSKDNI